MCFDNESDWYARVNEVTESVATREVWCYECGRHIQPGEALRHVHQQEYEFCECDFCRNQHCPDEDYDGPAECQDDLGQEFDCELCMDCCKLLKAIEAQEVAEGCPEYARQPLYGELADVFTEHQQNFEYAERAVDMFPELYNHRFIVGLLA